MIAQHTRWYAVGGQRGTNSVVYGLNRKGTTRFDFSVNRGHDDNGLPITQAEANEIAKLASLAPDMRDAIRRAYTDLAATHLLPEIVQMLKTILDETKKFTK